MPCNRILFALMVAVTLGLTTLAVPAQADDNLLHESTSSQGNLSVKSVVAYRTRDGRSSPMVIRATFTSRSRQRIISRIQDKRVETTFPGGSWIYLEKNKGFLHIIIVPGRGKWKIRTDAFFDPLRPSDAVKLQAATAALIEKSGDVIEAAQTHGQIVLDQNSKRFKSQIPPAVLCAGGVISWFASWPAIFACSTGVGCAGWIGLMTMTSTFMADACAEAIHDLQNPPLPPGGGGPGGAHGPFHDNPDVPTDWDWGDGGGSGTGGGCLQTTMQCGPYYWVSTGPGTSDGYWTQDCEVVCVER